MEKTLSAILSEIKNYFDDNTEHFHGAFTIENGMFTDTDFLEAIKENQYFKIYGSVFNDGVYKFNSDLTLNDEIFVGSVVLMAIPQEVVDLAEQVKSFNQKYGEIVNSPYNSESFGGYSYNKSSGNSRNANPTWQSVFANQLKRWRKICPY